MKTETIRLNNDSEVRISYDESTPKPLLEIRLWCVQADEQDMGIQPSLKGVRFPAQHLASVIAALANLQVGIQSERGGKPMDGRG